MILWLFCKAKTRIAKEMLIRGNINYRWFLPMIFRPKTISTCRWSCQNMMVNKQNHILIVLQSKKHESQNTFRRKQQRQQWAMTAHHHQVRKFEIRGLLANDVTKVTVHRCRDCPPCLTFYGLQPYNSLLCSTTKYRRVFAVPKTCFHLVRSTLRSNVRVPWLRKFASMPR